ncbi:MAG TPA: type II secretion system F family protein [Rhodocyclaceae bacterium]|nr:type II secretion system F family protein [Rhodocyclaceae bacterium]HMV54565.1 type II secretion system F family protein [Rhodocyclaceae bacterium]HMZ83858.1 type II secretion system F family protein [Rhodocyclaceae bacterium]HNB78669.1 type II secretion system F family protein [Rhodocyclaceae bacterium]HNH14147.1 type II secretion system F family protein [Rhodocyclaceae bacterium]
MDALLVPLILLAIVAIGFSAWRSTQVDVVRERLAFGMAEGDAEEEADLTAGDYGLEGLRRFNYQASLFIASWKGRAIIALLGAGMGYVVAHLQKKDLYASLSLSAALGLILLFAVLMILNGIRRERERKIRKALPDALELIAAIMEGGVAFEGALTHVVRESDPRHPLYFELSVMLDAMRRGRRRHEALKLWGARCNLAEVAEVVAALTQADQTGGSLAAVLHHHARTLFREYEASVQRRAERLPIRMMFPMLLTILPAMFIVTGLPSILRIVRVMEALMRRGM